MYNRDRCLLEDIGPEEVEYLRKLLPTIQMGKTKLVVNGEYRLGYDPDNREAILFRLRKPVISPNSIDEIIYKILSDRIGDLRKGREEMGDYSRFKF